MCKEVATDDYVHHTPQGKDQEELLVHTALKFAVLPIVAAVLAACARNEAAEAPAAPPAVAVAKVVSKPITEFDEFTGRFEAVERVEVRPRVSGYIAAAHFRAGPRSEEGRRALHHRPASLPGRAQAREGRAGPRAHAARARASPSASARPSCSSSARSRGRIRRPRLGQRAGERERAGGRGGASMPPRSISPSRRCARRSPVS